MERLKTIWSAKGKAYRDPRYVVIALVAALVFGLMTFQASHTRQRLDGFELSIFSFFSGWPDWLQLPFYTITQLGSLSAVLIWSLIGWRLRNLRAFLTVCAAGIIGWYTAKPFKVFVGRGRPQDLLKLPHLLHIEKFAGQGFPSGHATVAAACITALLFFVGRRQRKYLYIAGLLIGISRIYLGAHFPRDVLGGYALGAVIGSLVSLLLGTAKPTVKITPIKRRLEEMGITAKSVRRMDVDARGSIPMLIEDQNGNKYLAKLFGKQEYVADWLFKAMRFFKFKSFGDERPYLNSKHNVEHEALASMWSARAGVTTPAVRGYALASGYWMLVQDFVEGTPLDKLKQRDLSSKTLESIWKEIKLLHESKIAHRDLRAANVLIDKKGQPWLIDFGFAEVASRSVRQRMDVAELLMSTALIAGADEAYEAAERVMGRNCLIATAPYFQTSVFSQATTSQVKKHKDVYRGLMERLNKLSQKEIEKADVLRLNLKQLINIGLIGLFFIVILPQLGAFKGALIYLQGINFAWLIPIMVFSALTYVAAAMTTISLAQTPLKLHDALSVQVASSFVSKLMPSGLGSLTLFIRFLKRSGMELSEATALMVTESVLGFATFILPLGSILLLNGKSVIGLVHIKLKPEILLAIAALVVLVALIIWLVKSWRDKLIQKVNKAMADMRQLASSRSELSLAAGFSFGVTLAYATCLYLCLLAVGLHISPLAVLVVYAVATIAGSTIPTPGGLGALEVAMAAALVGMGQPQAPAYAAVILYRLATFWAPIPVGFIAYQYIQKRKLI